MAIEQKHFVTIAIAAIPVVLTIGGILFSAGMNYGAFQFLADTTSKAATTQSESLETLADYVRAQIVEREAKFAIANERLVKLERIAESTAQILDGIQRQTELHNVDDKATENRVERIQVVQENVVKAIERIVTHLESEDGGKRLPFTIPDAAPR
jgi:hypothetical protein